MSCNDRIISRDSETKDYKKVCVRSPNLIVRLCVNICGCICKNLCLCVRVCAFAFACVGVRGGAFFVRGCALFVGKYICGSCISMPLTKEVKSFSISQNIRLRPSDALDLQTCKRQVCCARLFKTDRKVTVRKITSHYYSGMQKSISELILLQNSSFDRLQQQNTLVKEMSNKVFTDA